MSLTAMLGIALIVAFVIWFFTIDHHPLFDWWGNLVVLVAGAWLIAFIVESTNHNREVHCRIVPEDKECRP